MTETSDSSIISRALRVRELDLRLSVTTAEQRGERLGIVTDTAVVITEWLAGKFADMAAYFDKVTGAAGGTYQDMVDITALLADQLFSLASLPGLNRVGGDALATFLSQEFGALGDEIRNLTDRARMARQEESSGS